MAVFCGGIGVGASSFSTSDDDTDVDEDVADAFLTGGSVGALSTGVGPLVTAFVTGAGGGSVTARVISAGSGCT